MLNQLDRSFYERPADAVARELLDCYIDFGGKRGKIVETEAYMGEYDLACHASKGRTKRTEILFGPGGFSYIYFIYGMHWLFNVVTGERGTGAAVLIRALEPVEGIEGSTNGPARWTKEFSLTGKNSGVDLLHSSDLKIWRHPETPARDIVVTPRINVGYAGVWADAPLRFFIRGNPYVSGPRNSSTLPIRTKTEHKYSH